MIFLFWIALLAACASLVSDGTQALQYVLAGVSAEAWVMGASVGLSSYEVPSRMDWLFVVALSFVTLFAAIWAVTDAVAEVVG